MVSQRPRAKAIALDVKSPDLDHHIAEHDVVISLVPFIYHADVIQSAIEAKTHVVTTSYVSPAMRELDNAAKEAGITVLNEVGVDPGVDHLYAIKTIGEVHDKGGEVGFPALACILQDLPRGRSRSSTLSAAESPPLKQPTTTLSDPMYAMWTLLYFVEQV